MGHALTENRHGLAVGGGVTIASGTAEREAALDLIDRHRPVESRGGRRRITVGGDRFCELHRKVWPLFKTIASMSTTSSDTSDVELDAQGIGFLKYIPIIKLKARF